MLIQSPNFFGTIEDVAAIADIAHKNGALLVVFDRGGGFAGRRRAAAARPTSSPWRRNHLACPWDLAGRTAA